MSPPSEKGVPNMQGAISQLAMQMMNSPVGRQIAGTGHSQPFVVFRNANASSLSRGWPDGVRRQSTRDLIIVPAPLLGGKTKVSKCP